MSRARIRIIKPRFFTDENVCSLPPVGRLLFLGIQMIADRDGILEDRPRQISIRVLPYDDVDINALLDQMVAASLIVRVDKHIHILNWRKWQVPDRDIEVTRERVKVRKVREFIIARDGLVCGICGGEIRAKSEIDIDHILPISKGGKTIEDNLRVAHARCNRKRGNRS